MMRHQKKLLAAGLSAALALVACDNPTAPRVRDAIEKVQHDMLVGNVSATDLDRTIRRALEQTDLFPFTNIQVERDGRSTSYRATVMERVYLPPRSSGGMPYARRMLLLWDTTSRRALALSSDDSVSTIAWPSGELRDDYSAPRIWGRVGFATELEQGGARRRFGSEGSLEFDPGAVTGPCKLKDMGTLMGFPFTERYTREGCASAGYHVLASVILEREDPTLLGGFLDEVARSRILLRVPGQDVPGTRIVTQCPEWDLPKPMPPMGCLNHANFYRDALQFASQLGVDLSRMKKTEHQGVYFQPWITGSGPALKCCQQFKGAVRYTVYAPSGAVVRRVDSTIVMADTLLRRLNAVSFVREGSRSLLLIPARVFERGASGYSMNVMDVTLLPCAPGLRRNDHEWPGNSQPDGGCYPAARFPPGR